MGLLNTRRRERELMEELESHLALHTEDNLKRGMTPEAARRAALLKLGGTESLKERYREQRSVPFVDHLGQDFRYAGRTLRRSFGFTVMTVLTIALGVAGPTIAFSLLKAWVLDPLPFAEPDGLVDVRRHDPSTGRVGSLNPADFLDFRRVARSLDNFAGYRPSEVRLTGVDRAERLRAAQVTANFFTVIGSQAALGRLFDQRDDQPGRSQVAVISHAMWRERFAGDPRIVGRVIRLNGEEHAVIGVLPETFQFTLLGRVQVWRPLPFGPDAATNRRGLSLVGLGRLRAGSSVEQARDELLRIATDLAKTYPATNANRRVQVVGLAEEVRRHHDLGFIVPVIFAMVVCVLLIACVNVTNVMLARVSTRRQEIAVRLALGASRRRIIRQWLVEHLLLFVSASAIGALMAVYGTAWITNSIPVENRQYLRNYAVLTVDRAVLLFALGTGAICGILFGLVPGWSGAQTDINLDLRDGASRTTPSRTATRLRNTLVIVEVSLALALLISAGLLVQTSRNLSRIDTGFDPQQLLTFEVMLDPQKYIDDAAIRGFYDRLLLDLRTRPGVVNVAAGSLVPFGKIGDGTEFFIEGTPELQPSETPVALFNQVTPDYSSALRLRLQHGRMLNASDGRTSLKVAVINATLASRYFGGRDAIGKRMRLGRESADLWTVVGIVDDVKNFEMIDRGNPQVYVPFSQRPNRRMMVVIRTSGDPEALAGTVRGAVSTIDAVEPVSRIFSMDSLIHLVTGPFETTAAFVACFGAITLLLAGVGVYGVVSYAFAQKTREIGIRMALGARRADVAGLVLKQIRTFMMAALIPGLALAWIIGHALQAMLVGVTPTDWRIYTTMTFVLGAVGVIAAAVPMRRATAIDPVTALHYE
jgi:putative ABC transport system permease protein